MILRLPPGAGNTFAGREQGKGDNLGALIGQPSGLLLGECATQGSPDQTLRRLVLNSRRPHVRRRRRTYGPSQVAYFNIFRPRLALQKADVLRLHDMGGPVGTGAHVLQSLHADGTRMIVEPFALDELRQNLNPIGRAYDCFSIMVREAASEVSVWGGCRR